MNIVAAKFIEGFEGRKYNAYLDQGGVATIGVGHTGSDVHLGLTWTDQQIDAALALDLAKAETSARKVLNKQLSEQSMGAIISFVFNLGQQAFTSSHLLQCINSGDYIGAAKAFLVWDHVAQLEVKGLLIRRLEEAALFLRGV